MTEQRVMDVARVETENGSHIEPPLDEAWPELTKLEWLAAVVATDTGLPIQVFEVKPGRFSLVVGQSSTGDEDYFDAWRYLSGVWTGAREAQRNR